MADIPSGVSEDDVFEEVKKQYMPIVLNKVREKSRGLAHGGEPSYIDVFRAFEEEFGQRVVAQPSAQRRSLIRDNLFIIIVAVMTIVFGVMGLAPFLFSLAQDKLGYKPDAFLDIAKLFAGVLVGGAAGAAAGAVSTSRREKS